MQFLSVLHNTVNGNRKEIADKMMPHIPALSPNEFQDNANFQVF